MEPSTIKKLIDTAISLGAGDAAVISPEKISVRQDLADLCREPQCRNFGQSASCPPHGCGPSEFRKLRDKACCAVVLRIIVPGAVLLSHEAFEVKQQLHHAAAGVEQAAKDLGYADSTAFAGGSCKEIFCRKKPACRVVSQNGPCRHPASARASMSGCGIDVSALMQTCGWPSNIEAPDTEKLSWLAGLVLIQ